MNEVDFSVKTYKPVGVISKLEQQNIMTVCTRSYNVCHVRLFLSLHLFMNRVKQRKAMGLTKGISFKIYNLTQGN